MGKLFFNRDKKAKVRNRMESQLCNYTEARIDAFDEQIEDLLEKVLHHRDVLSGQNFGSVRVTPLRVMGRVVGTNRVSRAFSIIARGRETPSMTVWERDQIEVNEKLDRVTPTPHR